MNDVQQWGKMSRSRFVIIYIQHGLQAASYERIKGDMMEEKVKEVDLFEPVRNYFHSQGYQVQAEVNHCDVVAHKGDSLIIVELKLNVNTTLLIQAAKRQRLTRD